MLKFSLVLFLPKVYSLPCIFILPCQLDFCFCRLDVCPCLDYYPAFGLSLFVLPLDYVRRRSTPSDHWTALVFCPCHTCVLFFFTLPVFLTTSLFNKACKWIRTSRSPCYTYIHKHILIHRIIIYQFHFVYL